jgi:hypothetical protein
LLRLWSQAGSVCVSVIFTCRCPAFIFVPSFLISNTHSFSHLASWCARKFKINPRRSNKTWNNSGRTLSSYSLQSFSGPDTALVYSIELLQPTVLQWARHSASIEHWAPTGLHQWTKHSPIIRNSRSSPLMMVYIHEHLHASTSLSHTNLIKPWITYKHGPFCRTMQWNHWMFSILSETQGLGLQVNVIFPSMYDFLLFRKWRLNVIFFPHVAFMYY